MTSAQDPIDLPLIVNGRSIWPSEGGGTTLELSYENGLQVRVPALSDEHFDEIERERRSIAADLAALSIFEVTDFLAKVGANWLEGRSAGRELAERHAPQFTGYPLEMVRSDYNIIGQYLRWRTYIYDQVASEFGTERIFDEWTAVQASYVRAFPRGLILHYLVGNLPLASVYSIVRGFITRNLSIAKLPTRDPISPIGLLMALQEVDPDHPLTRSVSIAYWPHDAPIAERCFGVADVVCVWGGSAATEAVKRQAPSGVPVVEFGPRWSAAVVDLTRCDPYKAAFRLAADASYYDQEACFSIQRAFVAGDVEEFRPVLADALERFAARMPIVSTNRDAMAHRSSARLEAEFLGWELDGAAGGWQVICVEDPAAVVDHPLGRTIYLHPIEDHSEVGRSLDRLTQTISVYPWELALDHRDAWALAGADRIVELGMSRHPRHGFTHDGMRALQHLVRLVALERPSADFYKYGDLDLDLLESNLFVT